MQTAQINIRVDGQQANASVNELNKNLNNTTTKTQSLRAELRQVTQELQGLQPGSQRFQELSERAGKLRDTIQDTAAVIKATAGSPIENLGKGLQGIASIGIAGFQGIASAQALFGVESKELEKTLVKLQALAGLSQAIQSLGGLKDTVTNIRTGFIAFGKSAVTALQGIKGAIAATGIGLLLIAVGSLVAYWDDIKEAIGGVSEETKRLAKAADVEVEVQQEKTKKLKLQENLLRLQGVSERDILRLNVAQNEREQESVKNKLEKNKQLLSELELQKNITKLFLTAAKIPFTNALTELFTTDTSELKKNIKETEDYLLTLQSQNADFLLKIKALDEQAQKERDVIRDSEVKKEEEKNKKILDNKRALEDAQVELMAEGVDKQLKQNENYYNRLIEDVRKGRKKVSETEQQLIDSYEKLKEQKAEAIRIEALRKQREAMRKEEDNRIALMEDGITKELATLKNKYDRAIDEFFIEYAKKGKLTDEEAKQEAEDYKELLELYKKDIKEAMDNHLKIFSDSRKALNDFEISIMEEGLDKQKALRLKQSDEELAKLNQFRKDKVITEEKYLQLQEQVIANYYKDIAEMEDKANEESLKKVAQNFEQKIQLYGSAIMELAQNINGLFDEISQQRLAKIDYEYNAELEKITQLRDAKILGDTQYENKKKELEQQRAVDEKKIKMEEFRRNKALNIAQAIMSGALAVLQALSAAPPPANFVLAGIAGAAASVQIATIAAQKFRAARGGIVPKNGLPGDVDSVDAKLAPGEAVINSRSTAMFPNVLSLINQAGGGQPLVPEMTQQTSSGGGMVFSQNQPQAIRAYVVETEMSDTQRRINRIQKAVEF